MTPWEKVDEVREEMLAQAEFSPRAAVAGELFRDTSTLSQEIREVFEAAADALPLINNQSPIAQRLDIAMKRAMWP